MDESNPYAAPLTPAERPPADFALSDYPRRRMRFWRIERLKDEMQATPLSERESLPYLVAFVVAFTIAGNLPLSDYNLWDFLGGLWSAAIAFVGTIYVYRRNGGIDGQYLLQRYLAIGWVVSIRCIVVIVVLMIGLLFIESLFSVSSDDTTSLEFLFEVAAETVIYWRIGHHVGDLANRTQGHAKA